MNAGYDTLISASEAFSIMQDEHTVFLDCQFALADPDAGRQAYLKSHIPGAYYLDLAHDLSSPVIDGVTGRHPLPNPAVLEAALRAAGVNSDSQVVVYDQSNGAYASRAWWLLNWLGHERVAVLNGGFASWEMEDLPVDNQWPAPKQGDFKYALRPNLLVQKEEVRNTADTVVDSRAYARFTGENEPIDPIAGHIEGAICLPFAQNLQEAGSWKSQMELAKRFEEANLLHQENPIFYCGSGVTACHNILAFKIATGSLARLYAGSWSEWIHYYPATMGE